MAETPTELDEDLVAEAARTLGTSTKRDTLVASLWRTVEEGRERRGRALAELQQMADEGAFDFDRLAELDK